MSLTIWGTVAGVQYALPMETLLGTANQLLGMNAGATALQYKSATFDNTSGQLAIPTSTDQNDPGHTFTGHLTTGLGYRTVTAVDRWYLALAGIEGIFQSSAGLFSAIKHIFNNVIVENQAADVVAAAIPNLSAIDGNFLTLTNNAGATVTTGFLYGGDNQGLEIETRFSITGGSVTLQHNAVSFILLGAADIALVDGDIVRWRKIDPNNDYWRMVSFTRGLTSSIITARGSIVVGTVSGSNPVVPQELLLGTDGQVIVATPSQTGLNSYGLVWTDRPPVSMAPNPFFSINQRQVGGLIADDVYTLDNWYALSQTNPITVSQLTNPADGLPYAIRLNQTNAVAQRMGIACILENEDCKGLRGRNFSIGFQFRLSNAQNLRVAVLEWTGAVDAVVSDVVLDWTSGTFTPGNFFNAANLSVAVTQAVGAAAITPAAWAEFMPSSNVIVNGTFSSNVVNLVLMIWPQAVCGQNVTLDISRVKFGPGNYAGPIYLPTMAELMNFAQRRYSKAFNYGQAPAQNTGAEGKNNFVQSVGAAAVQAGGYVTFPTRMRLNTPTITLYNPDSPSANVRNSTRGNNCTGSAAAQISSRGFGVSFTTSAGSAAGDLNYVQWDADAEL